MDSESEDRVVPPEKFADTFREPLGRLFNHFGACVRLDGEGKAVNKGTAAFVELEGRRLLFTAEHVASSVAVVDSEWQLLVPPASGDGAPGSRTAAVPKTFDLQHDTVIWASKELDFAVLEAAPELARSPDVAWFDARNHAGVTTKVRGLWKPAMNEGGSLPFYMLGFPNAGHVIFERLRVDLLTPLPMPVYITQLDLHPWQGHAVPAVAPQMNLEVDAREPGSKRPDLNNIEQRISDQLFSTDGEVEPLGGYSGGPVVLLARDGEFLVGILKEGGMVGDGGRAFATALDDALHAFTASQEWQTLISEGG